MVYLLISCVIIALAILCSLLISILHQRNYICAIVCYFVVSFAISCYILLTFMTSVVLSCYFVLYPDILPSQPKSCYILLYLTLSRAVLSFCAFSCYLCINILSIYCLLLHNKYLNYFMLSFAISCNSF